LLRLGDGDAFAAQSVGVDDPEARENAIWLSNLGRVPPDVEKAVYVAAVREAIRVADIVGLHAASTRGHYGRCGQWFRDWAPIAAECSASVHLHLLADGGYDAILDATTSLLVVSGHAGLAAALARRHASIVEAADVVIPLQFGKFGPQAEDWFPERAARLAETLAATDYHGWTALVAGGLPGKALMVALKRAGAVVVDVGSVADNWAGYRTRAIPRGRAWLDDTHKVL
jgi:hypothetical protein